MNRLGKGGCIMKTRSFFMLSFAVMAMSCAKEVLPENNPEENVELKLVPMEFTTALETKAGIVDGEGNVEWMAEDQICVFDNLGGDNLFSTAEGGKKAVFSGNVTENATEFYAVYPYRSAAEIDAAAKTVTSRLFPRQTAVLGSYAMVEGGAVMAAKTADNKLAFKNMTSHIRFTLADDMTDVKSITLMGNDDEILAGTYTIDFNGETPVLTVTKPETYVTLVASGDALVPGDYFFTILPVEFEAGFTVILSKTDGTQVAKKTTKAITALKERNTILPMAKLESTAYKSHMNYFVKYNDGFDITTGGVTFNNQTHKNGKLVNDTYGNGGVGSDGVYFIDPKCTTAKFSKAQAYSSLIVMGTDASERSAFDFYRQARPYDEGSVILLANLDCTVGDKNAFAQNTDTPGHAFDEFGDLTLYNCHFRNVGKNFFEFKNGAFTKINVHVEECEFGISGTTVYMLNASSLESSMQKLSFINNIFYAQTGATVSKFKLIHSDKLNIADLNVDKNTFVGTVIESRMMRIGDITTTLNFSRNLFVETSGELDTKLIDLRVGTNKAKVTGVATNNYYYTTGSAIGLGVGKSALTSMGTINSTAQLNSSPLAETWSPADGKFGPYTYGADVSNTVGAWRSDMKVSQETANYAAANYASVDLGTL